MNQQNLDYLKENLKYMGFGEQLNESLQKGILEGKKEFSIQLNTEVGKKPFCAELYFRRSDNTDFYFFNKWEGGLQCGGGKLKQTFYLNKGQGVTLKEGFNLLEGRAVYKELANKEGEKYHAWIQLDKNETDVNGNFKVNQYHQNYGFDLEKAVSQLPLKELSNQEQKDMLLKSLSKGNLQGVTFEKNGMTDKLFLAASPQFKSLNVYDVTGVIIKLSTLEKRFDFSFRQAENPEILIMVKGKPDINNSEVEGASEKQLGGQVKDVPANVKEEQSLQNKNNKISAKKSQQPQKTAKR
jgi:hypothetical protein